MTGSQTGNLNGVSLARARRIGVRTVDEVGVDAAEVADEFGDAVEEGGGAHVAGEEVGVGVEAVEGQVVGELAQVLVGQHLAREVFVAGVVRELDRVYRVHVETQELHGQA